MISVLRSILFTLYTVRRLVTYILAFIGGVAVGLAGGQVDWLQAFIDSIPL